MVGFHYGQSQASFLPLLPVFMLKDNHRLARKAHKSGIDLTSNSFKVVVVLSLIYTSKQNETI